MSSHPAPGVATGDEALAGDRAARRAAQVVFDRSLVLEAGAGTGKTTTLVARLLAWSLGPGWRRSETALADSGDGPPAAERVAARLLEGVVAITFTEAAAAEMAHRVGGELARLAAGQPPPAWLDLEAGGEPLAGDERTARARALLATLDHLVVRTFHAYCYGLLTAHPLEAGVHPDLEVDADGSRLDEVVREVVEAALPEAFGDPGDPAFLALAARGHGPPALVSALLTLAQSGLPAAELAGDPLAPERCRDFVERLRAACRAVAEAVAPRVAAGGRIKNARALAEGLVAVLGAGEDDLETLLARLGEALPANLVNHLKKWSKGSFSQSESALFADLPQLPDLAGELHLLLAHAGRLDPALLRDAAAALGPLLARVRGELHRRGIATFNDLLADAARLLAGDPGVRRSERRRIDQLLVDEFQDTDPLQCEVVGWLALDGPADERPGLFLVGDPKQSIYGWRNADLAAYDAFVERVLAAGGTRHTLAVSFRSVPAILDEVTRGVEPVMHEEHGVQPRFERLLPCAALAGESGWEGGGRAAVEHWVSWSDEAEEPAATPLADAAELEAEAIAADLVALHREGVAWRDAAVLLRSTGDLDVYLEALRRRRVPFAVGRDKQYYRRREVIEAAALVRTVLDPGDHLALLAVLRSSMVGVPDAALIPLWRRQLPQLLTDLTEPHRGDLERLAARVREAARATPRDVPGIDRIAGWETALLAFLEALAEARAAFDRDPADVFVERLRGLFLTEPVEAARYLGPYRLANLERFFGRLLANLEEGGGNATALLRMLRASVSEAVEAEEALPEEGLEDAVMVMTIHTAKGLDWPHVYLAQLHKQTAGERSAPRDVTDAAPVGDGWEVRLFGAASLGFDAVEERRRRVEAAERVRTLYVAMTRAERRLVLLGNRPAGGEPPPLERAGTHLDLLAHRRVAPPAPLDELWRRAADGEGGLRDDAGALWRFPGLGIARTGERAPAGAEAPAAPPAERAAEDSRTLARLAAEAAARAARPASRAASDEAHHRLRELLVSSDEHTGDGGEGGRDVALAVGSAVHRALETWDLGEEPVAELARQRGLLPGYLAGTLEAVREQALAGASALLQRFADGPLLPRLRALAPTLIARELPFLAPPGETPAADDTEPPPPVGFVAGAIDLIYRDPDSGRPVIADYKTDAVAGGAGLAARAAAYAAQGAVYAGAVRDALALDAAPRFELWFLAAGEVVEVEADLAGRVSGDDGDGPPPPAGAGPSQLSLFSSPEGGS